MATRPFQRLFHRIATLFGGQEQQNQVLAANPVQRPTPLSAQRSSTPLNQWVPQQQLNAGQGFDTRGTPDGGIITVSWQTGLVYLTTRGGMSVKLTRVVDGAIRPNGPPPSISEMDHLEQMAFRQLGINPENIPHSAQLAQMATVPRHGSIYDARGSQYVELNNPVTFADGSVGTLGYSITTGQVYVQFDDATGVRFPGFLPKLASLTNHRGSSNQQVSGDPYGPIITSIQQHLGVQSGEPISFNHVLTVTGQVNPLATPQLVPSVVPTVAYNAPGM